MGRLWKDLTWAEKIRRPVRMPWDDLERYQREVARWEREVGINQGPKNQVNITNNYFQLRNKKTGEIIQVTDEEYEVIDDEADSD